MGSFGLIGTIALLALATALISYRLATIALRFVRILLLRRATTQLLPVVRPAARTAVDPAAARRVSMPPASHLLQHPRSSSPPVESAPPDDAHPRAS